MKSSVKRRLQIRFVLLALAALVILQGLIVAFSIFRNYQQITGKADYIIRLTSTAPDSPEAAGSRYFIVDYFPADKSFSVDCTHTTLIKEKSAMKYARMVLDGGSDKGFVDIYRYNVQHENDRVHMVFLSRSAPLEAFHSNTETLIIISVAGVLVMAVFLIIVSGRVVQPIVKNREKQKEFITSASHELKTPLTVILADAQLLESDIGENEWLTDIMKQTSRMTEMTHRLVYLSRTEEQDGNFVKREFPVSDLAEEIAQSYRAVANNSGREYSVDVQKGITYCGDEKAIRELMTALLDNAFKYGTPGGQVGVTLTAERHGVRFSVQNTVSGIGQEQTKKFTERFYRSDTSDKVRGFGIGLSIARAVAEGHKGKLNIELKGDIIVFSAILK